MYWSGLKTSAKPCQKWSENTVQWTICIFISDGRDIKWHLSKKWNINERILSHLSWSVLEDRILLITVIRVWWYQNI